MDNVKVRKEVLLERIRKNRTKHRTIVEEAWVGYRKAVIEALDELLERAKAGRKIITQIGLQPPKDHTKEYDAVIDMLECEIKDVVEITRNDFRAFMRDEWVWRDQFLMSNRSYSQIATMDWLEQHKEDNGE
jgi:zona occludens toxin (predicted ATPase)